MQGTAEGKVRENLCICTASIPEKKFLHTEKKYSCKENVNEEKIRAARKSPPPPPKKFF